MIGSGSQIMSLVIAGMLLMTSGWLCATDQPGGTLRSPHSLGRDSCVSCHLDGKPQQPVPRNTQRTGQRPRPLSDSDQLCRRCHAGLQNSHYSGLNPFSDPTLDRWHDRAARPADVVLCLDCHTPHGEDGNAFLLADQYFRLCQLSRSINPHWQELMCNSCHLERFPEGKRPELLSNGDVNAICNRCHHSEFARREIHPVNIAPSPKIKVPEDMPLLDGKLTCSSCHHCALQKLAATDRTITHLNKNFLRHGSLSRVEYCFLCHIAESYRRLNPHQQLDESGKIREETCLFCHASRPDSKLTTPEQVTFLIANPVSYCVGCHPGFEHRHPSGGEHLVAPSPKILRSLSTSVARIGVALPLFDGKIVCTTCHNPHERGVIENLAAAEGAQHEHKLRLMPGRNQCTGCHWDK